MQLLNKINTVGYTNQILRQQHVLSGIATVLRADNVNFEEFRVFSDFKQLILDIARQVNAEIVTDVAIINLKTGQNSLLHKPDNRIIVVLESQSTFVVADRQVNVESGSILWTNEDVNIINTSIHDTFLIVIDFKEFLV